LKSKLSSFCSYLETNETCVSNKDAFFERIEPTINCQIRYICQVMKLEVFSSVEELKADRVPRKYSKKELIAQKNAARAINKIRVDNLKNERNSDSSTS